MAWSDQDADKAFECVRAKAEEGFAYMLQCARPVLEHGTKEEVAWLSDYHRRSSLRISLIFFCGM